MPRDHGGTGNFYLDSGNLRVTYVPATGRGPEADWAGSDVVRIQAYRQDPADGQALHRGAEFPVTGELAFIQLVQTLCEVYRAGRGPEAG